MKMEPLSADPRQVDAALRTQLSDIAAAAQLLLRRTESEHDRNYLMVAHRAAFRAMHILENRELARRLEDEDERRAVFATVDLVDWCREVTDHAAGLLASMNIVLTFRTGLTSLVTLADEQLLEQLLLALLSNAAKAMEEGGQLSVTLSANGKNALLTVGDEGCGLSGQALARLSTDKPLPPDLTPGAGAGFGLRLARTIAEIHGGLMILESAPGAGTRVAVSLPLREGYRPRLESPRTALEGFDRALVALSDVLPAEAFLPKQKGSEKNR